MHMMQWNETDLMSCLEVFPTIHEQDMYHEFIVERNSLRLSIFVYQYQGEVVIRLYEVDLPNPLFELPMRQCLSIRHVVPNNSNTDYLEFITGYRKINEEMMAMGVRVCVTPQISIEVL